MISSQNLKALKKKKIESPEHPQVIRKDEERKKKHISNLINGTKS